MREICERYDLAAADTFDSSVVETYYGGSSLLIDYVVLPSPLAGLRERGSALEQLGRWLQVVPSRRLVGHVPLCAVVPYLYAHPYVCGRRCAGPVSQLGLRHSDGWCAQVAPTRRFLRRCGAPDLRGRDGLAGHFTEAYAGHHLRLLDRGGQRGRTSARQGCAAASPVAQERPVLVAERQRLRIAIAGCSEAAEEEEEELMERLHEVTKRCRREHREAAMRRREVLLDDI